MYICYNRYARSTSAACGYGCVELLQRSRCFGAGILLGELLWCWDFALVSCFGGFLLGCWLAKLSQKQSQVKLSAGSCLCKIMRNNKHNFCWGLASVDDICKKHML